MTLARSNLVRDQNAAVAQRAIYLGPSQDVSNGSSVMVVKEQENKLMCGRICDVITVRKVLLNAQFIKPRIHMQRTNEEKKFFNSIAIECTDCTKQRFISKSNAKRFEDKPFKCEALSDTHCRTPQADDNKVISLRQGRPKAFMVHHDDRVHENEELYSKVTSYYIPRLLVII